MEGGHSPREAWKPGPQNKSGAGRGAAGGQIPPLPEGSALLAATAAAAAAAAAAGHGPARRPRPRRTGAGRRGAPSSARGRRAARGMGFGSAPSPEAENRGRREPQRGSGGGVLPAAEPCSAAAPAPERPGRGAASRAPAGALPERGAGAGGVRESPPPPQCRQPNPCASRPLRFGSRPLTGVTLPPRRPIRYPGLLLSRDSETTPSLASRSPCRSPFTVHFPVSRDRLAGAAGEPGGRH